MKSSEPDLGIYVTPENSKIVKHYDISPSWGKELNQANQERVEATLRLVPTGISNILDLGCGDGAIANPLFDKGIHVTGLDISLSALKHLKGNGIRASSECLPFRDKLFDLVICAEILEHLPQGIYEKTLGEIERITNTYIIVTTPNREYLPSGHAKCSYCHYIFHTNLHFRSFDISSHQGLFHQFSLIKTVEINQWTQNPFITQINQRLLGIYAYKKGVHCPYCSHMIQQFDQGILKIALSKAAKKMREIFPRNTKARWIASLYQRQDT